MSVKPGPPPFDEFAQWLYNFWAYTIGGAGGGSPGTDVFLRGDGSWSNELTGDFTVGGNTTVKGNTSLGDAAGDTLTISSNTVTWSAATILHSSNHRFSKLLGVNVSGINNAYSLTVEANTDLQTSTQGGIMVDPQFSASADTASFGINVNTRGAAASHTTPNVAGIRIQDHTIGAAQTVTNSYGLLVSDRTSAATLIAGVSTQVSSGSGKWNVYSSGTANSAFAGSVRIGSTVAPTVALDVTGAALISTTLGVTGTLTATGDLVVNGNTTLGDATGDAITFTGRMSSGILWTTDSTNDIGATGANRPRSVYVGSHLEVASTASIGTTFGVASMFTVAGTAVVSGVTQRGINVITRFSTGSTTAEHGVSITTDGTGVISTTAEVAGLNIADHTKGGSQTVTNSYGVLVLDRTSAFSTLNAGVRLNLTSGTGKWNVYSIGTADNAFAGNVRIGSVTAPTVALDVTGAALISSTLGVTGTLTASGTLTAASTVTLSPANANVTLSPTGTGLVTINPATAGALDNVVIGANTALAGTFTTLSATNFSAWTSWTPTRTGWTDVGSPTVTARYCRVRNLVFFQIKIVPGTTVATVAGTSYTDLPVTVGASGLAGTGTMGDDTTRISIGSCEFDYTNGRVYVPTQTATGDTLTISGWYEV